MKQPLDMECKCLPLAKITIEGDFGVVTTKAAVTPVELNKDYYLLGNKTAQLIEGIKKLPIPLNVVETHSQAQAHSSSEKSRCRKGRKI